MSIFALNNNVHNTVKKKKKLRTRKINLLVQRNLPPNIQKHSLLALLQQYPQNVLSTVAKIDCFNPRTFECAYKTSNMKTPW